MAGGQKKMIGESPSATSLKTTYLPTYLPTNQPTPIQRAIAHLSQGPSFAIQAVTSYLAVHLDVSDQLFFVGVVAPLLPDEPSEQHSHLCVIEALLELAEHVHLRGPLLATIELVVHDRHDHGIKGESRVRRGGGVVR